MTINTPITHPASTELELEYDAITLRDLTPPDDDTVLGGRHTGSVSGESPDPKVKAERLRDLDITDEAGDAIKGGIPRVYDRG